MKYNKRIIMQNMIYNNHFFNGHMCLLSSMTHRAISEINQPYLFWSKMAAVGSETGWVHIRTSAGVAVAVCLSRGLVDNIHRILVSCGWCHRPHPPPPMSWCQILNLRGSEWIIQPPSTYRRCTVSVSLSALVCGHEAFVIILFLLSDQ